MLNVQNSILIQVDIYCSDFILILPSYLPIKLPYLVAAWLNVLISILIKVDS